MITPSDVKRLSVDKTKINELIKEMDQSIKSFHGN